MSKTIWTNFPDEKHFKHLIEHGKKKLDAHTPLEQLVTYCSAAMNWIADYITDETIQWSKQELDLDDLWLTGTCPEWNKIIIEQCERSPKKLRELLKNDSVIKELFKEVIFEDLPILVRYEEGKYKVLDGMHRTIAAIRDSKKTIEAFVAKPRGAFRPKCEPHVIYDLLRAYHRKLNQDRDGLITALRFLRHSYANVDDLLKNRFSKGWVPDDKIQKIIQEALQD